VSSVSEDRSARNMPYNIDRCIRTGHLKWQHQLIGGRRLSKADTALNRTIKENNPLATVWHWYVPPYVYWLEDVYINKWEEDTGSRWRRRKYWWSSEEKWSSVENKDMHIKSGHCIYSGWDNWGDR
jgi:hypothetical protein